MPNDILLRLAELQGDLADAGEYHAAASVVGDAIVEITRLRLQVKIDAACAELVASENAKYARAREARIDELSLTDPEVAAMVRLNIKRCPCCNEPCGESECCELCRPD